MRNGLWLWNVRRLVVVVWFAGEDMLLVLVVPGRSGPVLLQLILVVPGWSGPVLLLIDILWGTIDIVTGIIDISPGFIIAVLQTVISINAVLPAVFWSGCGSDPPEALGNIPGVPEWEGNCVNIAPRGFLSH